MVVAQLSWRWCRQVTSVWNSEVSWRDNKWLHVCWDGDRCLCSKMVSGSRCECPPWCPPRLHIDSLSTTFDLSPAELVSGYARKEPIFTTCCPTSSESEVFIARHCHDPSWKSYISFYFWVWIRSVNYGSPCLPVKQRWNLSLDD